MYWCIGVLVGVCMRSAVVCVSRLYRAMEYHMLECQEMSLLTK